MRLRTIAGRLVGWNCVSTAGKLQIARGLYRALATARSIARKPSVVIATRRGAVFELDLAEGIDLASYFGIYEPDTYHACQRLVAPGDTVLDIGANSGVHTLPLAMMAGDRGRVIAFEPTTYAFTKLMRNLALNPALQRRVTPVMAYLTDHRSTESGGSPTFYARWKLDDTERQHPIHRGSLESAADAASFTLDDYASANDIRGVKLIKLDVDGYEYKVIRGGVAVLERDRPAIVTEICPYALEERGDSIEALIDLLSSCGYSFYDERTFVPIPSDPRLIRATIRPRSSINIVARPRERDGVATLSRGGPSPSTGQFIARQRDFFETADEEHFAWQTRNPFIARTERALLDGLPLGSSGNVLEVGCGEGGNIVNALSSGPSRPRIIGLDLFEQKLRFAVRAGVPGSFICADASDLPFPDAAFDVVLCRDVLHHVADPARVVAELRRVCRPDGNVWILEPNGRNPLMQLLALARPHERGLRRNSIASLRGLISPYFPRATYGVRQPMPIYRLICHHSVGFPGLARFRAFTLLMGAWDFAASRMVPRAFWAYVLVRS